MKLLLKVLVAPLVLALTLFVWICTGLLYCSSYVFGLAGTIFGLMGLLVLVTTSVKNGLTILVLAFLISPVGIPMAAVWLVGKVELFRYTLQEKIYG